jgi:tRNA G37 N-methylase Trm5
MGYLFNTIKFLPFALTSLREGGIIHFHSIVHKSNFNTEKAEIKKFIEKLGYDLNKIDYQTIKSYSPFYYHIVYDIDISS